MATGEHGEHSALALLLVVEELNQEVEHAITLHHLMVELLVLELLLKLLPVEPLPAL